MTVCIAAVAGRGNYIVSASDTAIFHGTETNEASAWKSTVVDNRTIMFSGEFGISDLIKEDLVEAILKSPDNSTRTVGKILKNVFNRHLQEWAMQNSSLYPIGMTMKEFMDSRKTSGDEVFKDILRDVKSSASGFANAVLIAGWGIGETTPEILTMDNSGLRQHFTTGFAAIGGGASSASSAMFQLSYKAGMPLSEVIYCVCAAKFAAERVDGVGKKNTMMWVFSEHSGGFFVQPYEVEKIRDIWEDRGKPRIPGGAQSEIDAIIEHANPKKYPSGKEK